jgi:sugar lactone lactonase YvrE
MDQGTMPFFNEPIGMAFTASGMLVVCDRGNDRLRRVDLNNGHVTTIEHPFPDPRGVAHSSDGTLYVAETDCMGSAAPMELSLGLLQMLSSVVVTL